MKDIREIFEKTLLKTEALTFRCVIFFHTLPRVRTIALLKEVLMLLQAMYGMESMALIYSKEEEKITVINNVGISRKNIYVSESFRIKNVIKNKQDIKII